ncbi:MAG: hypothetical protein R2838_22890 [Caldilineaceae bacterium]
MLAVFLLLGVGGFAWRTPTAFPGSRPTCRCSPSRICYSTPVRRLPADEFGISSMNYSEAAGVQPGAVSVLLVGHSHQQAIAEIRDPGPSSTAPSWPICPWRPPWQTLPRCWRAHRTATWTAWIASVA